jgi:hypothetical protein
MTKHSTHQIENKKAGNIQWKRIIYRKVVRRCSKKILTLTLQNLTPRLIPSSVKIAFVKMSKQEQIKKRFQTIVLQQLIVVAKKFMEQTLKRFLYYSWVHSVKLSQCPSTWTIIYKKIQTRDYFRDHILPSLSLSGRQKQRRVDQYLQEAMVLLKKISQLEEPIESIVFDKNTEKIISRKQTMQIVMD